MFEKIRQALNVKGRIYILPTKLGVYFLFITFVLFLFSISYGNPLAYTATFLFSSVIVASTIFTNYNLSGISAKVALDGKSFYADEKLVLEIALLNNSSKVRFDLEARHHKSNSNNSISINANEASTLTVSLPKLERGEYLLEKIRVHSSFPFGLFFSWKNIALNQPLFVYPSANGDDHLMEGSSTHSEKESSQTIEGNEDFYQHKAYIEGESWKRINWKVWAKSNVLLTKQFESPTTKSFHFNFARLTHLNEEKALEQLSYWVKKAMTENHLFSMELGNIQIPLGSGVNHGEEALRQLASYKKKVTKL